MVDSAYSTENLNETRAIVAQRQFESGLQESQIQATTEHTNDPPLNDNDEDGFRDPRPPDKISSLEEKKEYEYAVNRYSRELLTHLESIPDLRGEELWIEYTCSFRKETILAMTTTLQLDWARFFRSRVVRVMSKRGTRRSKAL